ncbi:Holliday junction resolvase RuvX [Nesterenkonia sp. YGD6]|uniref:Holliday junction resolvase RuvX n=1 Tax=Nesterenkonia sp. YGD6 TaxID=2901231 RepID=UPI001F4CEB67|nr:Holliday junction resolvase RuvX [Nesterenkonia sp. YGD6]
MTEQPERDSAASAPRPTARAGVRLGIDVGDARVGLASSDPDALIATPVMTLRRDPNRASDLTMLITIIKDRQARAVYVGLPLSLSGGETLSTQKARDYAGQLAGMIQAAELPTEVYLIDERLSTVSAATKMRASGVASKDQRTRIDQAAAVEILTHALDLRQSWGREPGTPVSAP